MRIKKDELKKIYYHCVKFFGVITSLELLDIIKFYFPDVSDDDIYDTLRKDCGLVNDFYIVRKIKNTDEYILQNSKLGDYQTAHLLKSHINKEYYLPNTFKDFQEIPTSDDKLNEETYYLNKENLSYFKQLCNFLYKHLNSDIDLHLINFLQRENRINEIIFNFDTGLDKNIIIPFEREFCDNEKVFNINKSDRRKCLSLFIKYYANCRLMSDCGAKSLDLSINPRVEDSRKDPFDLLDDALKDGRVSPMEALNKVMQEKLSKTKKEKFIAIISKYLKGNNIEIRN